MTTESIQITQVLPPRDMLSLADYKELGFASRAQLRRWLVSHHVPVDPDGNTLRFSRDALLAGLARGSRVLPTKQKTRAPKPVDDELAAAMPRGWKAAG